MFQDIDNGEGTFLIVDRLEDKSGQTYVQTSRSTDGTWTVEYRDGSVDQHYATEARDLRTAHTALAGWVFEIPGWREAGSWSKLDL